MQCVYALGASSLILPEFFISLQPVKKVRTSARRVKGAECALCVQGATPQLWADISDKQR